jgi:putative acetyltransferase
MNNVSAKLFDTIHMVRAIRKDVTATIATIRPERAEDVAAIRAVNERAFGGRTEAMLVEVLRTANRATVSLVAQHDDHVVGHILFSPITVESAPTGARGVGLAPMSVLPEFQNKGIGSRLVREGLAACQQAGYDIVVVLGHIDYYPRFGFARANDFGLANEYEASDAFMVLELKKGALKCMSGLVKFAPEFREAGC